MWEWETGFNGEKKATTLGKVGLGRSFLAVKSDLKSISQPRRIPLAREKYNVR